MRACMYLRARECVCVCTCLRLDTSALCVLVCASVCLCVCTVCLHVCRYAGIQVCGHVRIVRVCMPAVYCVARLHSVTRMRGHASARMRLRPYACFMLGVMLAWMHGCMRVYI